MESKKIRDAARDEICTMQIVGVCNHNPETTVFAHLPDRDSHGMAKKADDWSGCFSCSSCHDVIDYRNKKAREELQPGELEWYMRRAQTRTMRRLFQKGVIRL